MVVNFVLLYPDPDPGKQESMRIPSWSETLIWSWLFLEKKNNICKCFIACTSEPEDGQTLRGDSGTAQGQQSQV